MARSPLFAAGGPASKRPAASSPHYLGSLNKHPFRAVAFEGWPTVADMLVLCDLIAQFRQQGCPENRRVVMTATSLCSAAGYSAKGGWQFEHARESLVRLLGLTLMYVKPSPDGTPQFCMWSPLDSAWVQSRPSRDPYVRISPQLAALVRERHLVYLDRATLHALYARDPYAARLWTFLESESYRRPVFTYRVFSAPEGEPPEYTHVPAIADLLWLSKRAVRPKARERIQKAAEAINEVDARYRLTVKRAVRPSMWNLCVRKKERP